MTAPGQADGVFRHGYRPLWTTWQATPASAFR